VIADGIESDRVYPIAARWNILAHAIVESLSTRTGGRSLNYICEQLLDKYGDRVVFPFMPG
jgi:hypothetical protein